MTKLNSFLNILMGSFFGVFVGRTISNYREYCNYPEIYVGNSAPWYCFGALQSFLLFAAVVIVCVVIKLIIRRNIKRKLNSEAERTNGE